MTEAKVLPPRKGRTLSGARSLEPESAWSLGLVAALFWVFVEYMRLQDKYDVFAGFPFGMVALVLLVLGLLTSRGGMWMGGSVGGWTAALMVWGLICSLLAGTTIFRNGAYYEVSKTVLVFFALVSLLNTPKRVMYFVYMLMFVYFAHTNFAVREWAMSGFQGLPKGQYVGAGFLRNPNDFGAALSAAWGISLFLAIHDKALVFGRWPARWLHWVGTVLFFAGIVTCSSRGTALGLAAGALYLWVAFVKGARAKLAWAAGLLVIAIGVVIAMSEEQLARYQTMGEDDSSQDRFRTWEVAWNVFTDHPVFGVGVGNFVNHIGRFEADGTIFVQHNVLLQAMSELGVLGLVCVLGLFLAGWITVRGALAHRAGGAGGAPTQMEAILLGCGVCLVSLFVNAQTITVLYYPFVWVLFAIIASAARCLREERAGKGDGRNRVGAPRAVPRASPASAQVRGVHR